MWTQGEGAAGAAHKRPRGSEEEKWSTTGSSMSRTYRMLHNLDTRVRAQEGQLSAFFLAEGETVLLPALLAANKHYEDLKPSKGQPHQLGPRRTTLAGAVMLALAKADLSKCSKTELELIEFYNAIAEKAHTPAIHEQQEIMKVLVAKYTTAQMMEPEVRNCQFFKTKQSPRYLFAIEFQPHSPLRHCYEFIRVGLLCANAIPTDGSPPKGPLIREIPFH